eukprot:Tbor_TRINITY_DN5331_c2_g1::TRINITY_DN5331_c2_g1_i3::g.4732::m.4732
MSSDNNNNNNNIKSEEPQTTENITPQVVPTEDPTTTSNNLNNNLNNNNNSNNNNNNNNNNNINNKNIPRLNINNDLVLWINNIETDMRYTSLRSTLKVLLSRDQFQSPFPKRNILNMIIIFDPKDEEKKDKKNKKEDKNEEKNKGGFDILIGSLRAYEQGFAVRFGFLIIDKENLRLFSDDEDIPITFSAASMIVLKWASDMNIIHRILFSIISNNNNNNNNNGLKGLAALNAAIISNSQETLETLLSQEKYKSYYRQVQNYIYNFGISSSVLPLYLLNGRISSNNDRNIPIDGIESEFLNIREYVQSGVLKDNEKDIYNWIMNETKAVKRYQSLLYNNKEYISMSG